jgi:hypothetical protein
MDTPFQSPVDAFFQGVSRQPALKRAPNQVEDADNFYASVDLAGLTRRPGTRLNFSLTRSNYAAGPHLCFKTTDGQRWVLLRLASPGQIEVRNFDTGNLATLSSSVPAQAYLNINGGARLKYLPIADTVVVLNPDQAVAATEPAVPALSEVYFVVRRTSSANQNFYITRASGGSASFNIPANNTTTREVLAAGLRNAAQTTFGPAGLTFTLLGENASIIKCVGPTNVLNELSCRNDWDPDAIYAIKGRVSSTSDLPAVFEEGVVVAVDPGRGDPSLVYYVRWNRASGTWIETSYLANDASTLTFTASSMPVELRRTGANAFSLDVAPWKTRTRGDAVTNPRPAFVGKRIADITVWKGRLVVAADDTLTFSQPDDLYNFWKETARESRPSDVIEQPCDSQDVTVIEHVIPFRNKLIVTSENTQLEVPGDQPLTAQNITIGVATKFNLNRDCRPVVVGDSLYYAGTAEGRGALWQYFYDDSAASNTAFDLSKHVPDYIPGRVTKLQGVSQSGRLFAFSPRTPTKLYVHTSYWADNQRQQNAWTSVTLQPGNNILDYFAQDASLLLLVENVSGNALYGLTLSADAQPRQRVSAVPLPLPYLDQLVQGAGAYQTGPNRTDFPVPASMAALPVVACTWHSGDGWWREYTGLVVSGILQVPGNALAGANAEVWLGVRFQSTLIFSPFYWRDENGKATPHGRYQVRWVGLECATTGDFTAFISRPDRIPITQVQRSARFVGSGFVRPTVGSNLNFRIPFNSRGDAATLTVQADSSAPWDITGYTLTGRYTNPIKA